MTTPAPDQPAATSAPELRTGASADETQNELERRARLESLEIWLRRARELDNQPTPPPAGPRDLGSLATAMAGARAAQAYLFPEPNWHALVQVYERTNETLRSLSTQAERTPQAAIQAARITTLAASLIARHSAQVSAYLDAWNQSNTPGAAAMRNLTRAAEEHATQAAGIQDGQTPDTPRLLITHINRLNKELRRAEPSTNAAQDVRVDDPDDPALDSALTAGAAVEPELAEASQLMNALSELAARARRAGHRLTLDVRLHGTVEMAQLRGFEMISGIARAVMKRYDNQGRGTEGRRNIAAMIFHYAEQRLERMRGTLADGDHRAFGHYESEAPERYMDALFEESDTVRRALLDKDITPRERTDLQIRFLLAQKEIAAEGADGVADWATQPIFPPHEIVAGMRSDSPVETRRDLIDALRRRVENNPFHRDAQFLNTVADRFAREIAGPPELTADALAADLSADQVRTLAAHLVEYRTVASPLVLSETAELNLSHPQAERALAVLQTLNVVGPPNGLEARQTLIHARNELSYQLSLLEERLPYLLELQEGAADRAKTATLESPAQPDRVPAAEAPAMAVPAQTQAPAEPSQPTPVEPVPATAAPKLPRRDRSAERRHPGNLGTRRRAAVESPTDQDLADLFEGQEDRVKELSQTVIDGREARDAEYPAPTEAAPAKSTTLEEAQQRAQEAEPTVGVGVR
jgi:hypothetical protein